jgi:hypothetical protein
MNYIYLTGRKALQKQLKVEETFMNNSPQHACTRLTLWWADR